MCSILNTFKEYKPVHLIHPGLIYLFHSVDVLESNFVTTLYHSIYNKVLSTANYLAVFRNNMLKAMNDT